MLATLENGHEMGCICLTLTLVRPLHSSKADEPISVTLFPIVTELMPKQHWKALFPMLITLSSIMMDSKPQPQKAISPICFKLLGIIIEDNPP
jgi:hypothetical protein